MFDATGVFGVEDCSTVVDSYSSLTSTEQESVTILNAVNQTVPLEQSLRLLFLWLWLDSADIDGKLLIMTHIPCISHQFIWPIASQQDLFVLQLTTILQWVKVKSLLLLVLRVTEVIHIVSVLEVCWVKYLSLLQNMMASFYSSHRL